MLILPFYCLKNVPLPQIQEVSPSGVLYPHPATTLNKHIIKLEYNANENPLKN